jgi:hypothetical protein
MFEYLQNMLGGMSGGMGGGGAASNMGQMNPAMFAGNVQNAFKNFGAPPPTTNDPNLIANQNLRQQLIMQMLQSQAGKQGQPEMQQPMMPPGSPVTMPMGGAGNPSLQTRFGMPGQAPGGMAPQPGMGMGPSSPISRLQMRRPVIGGM